MPNVGIATFPPMISALGLLTGTVRGEIFSREIIDPYACCNSDEVRTLLRNSSGIEFFEIKFVVRSVSSKVPCGEFC